MLLDRIKEFFVPHKSEVGTGSLPADIVNAYYSSRTIWNKKHLCHAPFNNMYFNSVGDVANCWLTFEDPEQYTEEKTIKEIWLGEKFTRLREAIKKQNLDNHCSTCKHNLETGNFVNVLARAYDNKYPLTEYPSMMEFELSNSCNLECTMCTGLLSSSIRNNRDKLPPLKSPYGAKFVEELKEFIPHLHEARFNGGEPFLIKIYWEIWDLILSINPKITMVIATNGTVLNERVKDYLKRGNFNINLSIDGMSPETYNNIRINGDIKKVLENFKWFRDFCHEYKRTLCVMVNPMRQNWHEMADMVNFCNENNVNIWYNTITRPVDQAIWNLPYTKLKEIYETLSSAKLIPNKSTDRNIYQYNVSTYKNLVEQQIKTWMIEAGEREKSFSNNIKPAANIKAEFETAWLSFLNDKYPDENQRISISKKLTDLKNELADETPEETFYKIVSSSTLEILVSNLESYDLGKLKERFRGAVKSA
jgi:radical SAM protein with 4Fe4S-binding SPASM domain